LFYPKRPKNKNILCIETYWDENEFEPTSNMTPLLDFVTTARGTGYTYRLSHTIEELTYILSTVKPSKCNLIIFAFHGRSDKILLGNKSEFIVSFLDLAKLMGRRFEGCGIHFSACSVLNSFEENIYEFIDMTGASFLTGYGQSVDYIEAGLMDMAFIGKWFRYKNTRSLFKNLKHSYKDFIKENNFLYFAR
jgi:hypothetical protein